MDKLVGKTFKFYGAFNNYFKLDRTIYEALENPDDGYRSFLEHVMAVNKKVSGFFKQPIAKVKVVEDDYIKGWALVDIKDDHVWLEMGTGDWDDWYPYFMFAYHPKKGK